MRQKFFLIFFGVTFLASISWAIPPSELTLEYDSASKVLHIHIVHISANVHKHYIRNIEISKNGQSIKNIRLVSQDTGREVSQDYAMDAKEGDVIAVKAICNQAGTEEATITIAPAEKKSDKSDPQKNDSKKIDSDKADPNKADLNKVDPKKLMAPATTSHKAEEEKPRPYSSSY